MFGENYTINIKVKAGATQESIDGINKASSKLDGLSNQLKSLSDQIKQGQQQGKTQSAGSSFLRDALITGAAALGGRKGAGLKGRAASPAGPRAEPRVIPPLPQPNRTPRVTDLSGSSPKPTWAGPKQGALYPSSTGPGLPEFQRMPGMGPLPRMAPPILRPREQAAPLPQFEPLPQFPPLRETPSFTPKAITPGGNNPVIVPLKPPSDPGKTTASIRNYIDRENMA
jgi:hypothetical protein